MTQLTPDPSSPSPPPSAKELHRPRSLAEWVSFSIASGILSTVIGLISYVWLTNHHQPPTIELMRQDPIRQAGTQFYVPFEVTNTGGETATNVEIIAELQVGDRTETGTQQIDFLSRNETESGAFVFNQDPRQGTLSLRVGSYQLP